MNKLLFLSFFEKKIVGKKVRVLIGQYIADVTYSEPEPKW